MKLKITGTPKEITDLVLGIQSQQLKEDLINYGFSKPLYTDEAIQKNTGSDSVKRKNVEDKPEYFLKLEQDYYCVAKHLKSFLEDADKEQIADIRKPCCDCKYILSVSCNLVADAKFASLSDMTGIDFIIRHPKVKNEDVTGNSKL